MDFDLPCFIFFVLRTLKQLKVTYPSSLTEDTKSFARRQTGGL